MRLQKKFESEAWYLANDKGTAVAIMIPDVKIVGETIREEDVSDFIVTACNAHDKLVSLLNECLTDEFGISSKALIEDITAALDAIKSSCNTAAKQ